MPIAIRYLLPGLLLMPTAVLAQTEATNAGWISVLPPLLAIALALVFRQVIPALFLGLLAGAFAWFVATGDQNIPGDLGGVEGAQQFGLFFAGAAGAVVATMVVASLAQIRTSGEAVEGTGVEALRNQTLLAVAMARFRRWRGHDRR